MIKNIIDLINNEAEKGRYQVDLSGYDISLSRDMIEEIEAHFGKDEISINGTVISW